MKVNPFKPNHPVSPGMFVGRVSEIRALKGHIVQSRAGHATNFMVTGERGIGKSSLLNYVRYVAQGLIPIDGTTKMKFLVLDSVIDANSTQLGLVRRIELGLRKELGRSEVARKFLSECWSFLQRIEAGGVKIGDAKRIENDELVLDEFAYSLAEIVERLSQDGDGGVFSARFDGILLLVDEADSASRDLNLGSLIKLLTERLQRRGCDRLMIGLAGLPELRNVLHTSHPSSLRMFEEVVLGRLDDGEVQSVVDICLEEAERLNCVKPTISEEARKALFLYSEGYPHFIQQFGYSAFAADKDDDISVEDVHDGALGTVDSRGALELIGDRYYRDNFYNKIQKENYRQVLRIMANNLDGWIKKAGIRKQFRGKTSTLDNAIKALRDRHIILSKEGERGVYRLQHMGFALWIKTYTADPSSLRSGVATHVSTD